MVPTPPEVAGQGPKPFLRGSDEAIEGARFADHGSDLGGGLGKHLNFIRGEDSWLDGLHYEDTLEDAAVDEGNSEEGLVGVLTGLVEIFEAGVAMRLLHGYGTHLLGHQACEAFVDGHAQLADALARSGSSR